MPLSNPFTEGFYAYLGYVFASLIMTALAFGVIFLAAYIMALVEIHQENKARRQKENHRA